MARKKLSAKHETHGALAPVEAPKFDLKKAFGMTDGYQANDPVQYRRELGELTTPQLHEHAHEHGVVPRDPRDKLTNDLVDKFLKAKAQSRPMRSGRVATRADKDPAFAKMMTQWKDGEYRAV